MVKPRVKLVKEHPVLVLHQDVPVLHQDILLCHKDSSLVYLKALTITIHNIEFCPFSMKTFCPISIKTFCPISIIKNSKKVRKKILKCPQDQIYLSPASWYQAVQLTLNFYGYFIFYPINVIFGMQLSFVNLSLIEKWTFQKH